MPDHNPQPDGNPAPRGNPPPTGDLPPAASAALDRDPSPAKVPGSQRSVKPLASLRARLALAMALALLPAAVFLLVDAVLIRQKVRAEASADLGRLTELVAQSYGQQIDQAARLLATVSQFPEVQTGDAAACSQRLAELVAVYAPERLGFGVADRTGEMFCISQPVTTTVRVGDRLWFREALRTGEFAIGEYAISRPLGIPALGLGYPVRNASGEVTRVLAYNLRLELLQRETAELPLPQDAVLAVTDHNGTILARTPDGEQWVGQPQAPALLAEMQAQGTGVVETTGEDGQPQLFGFTPIRGPGETEVWLSIGRAPGVVYADVQETIARDMISIATVLLAALVALWLVGSRLLQRIEKLVAASQALAAGAWQARAPVRAKGDELDQLGRAFNDMAATLEQRERHLRLGLDAARMATWTWDAQTEEFETSDNVGAMSGLSTVKYAQQGYEVVHPDDAVRHQAEVAAGLAALTPYRSEFRIVRPDNGEIVWVEERGVPVLDATGKLQKLAGVTLDITERKTSELALQGARAAAEQTAARIGRLQTVTAALAGALTLREVKDVILDQGAAALEAKAIAIKLISEDGQWLEDADARNYPAAVYAAYRRYPLAALTPMADAVRSGVGVWLPSEEAYLVCYPHLQNDIRALELGAAAAIPLVVGDQVLGGLGISFGSSRPFDAEEREYLMTLGSQCAQALERARLYEVEQQARAELEVRVSERTAELERSNRELNQFAYVASHDLKAPLRAIDNLAAWISQDAAESLPQASAEHLLKLRGRVKRMEKLLDDLLAYSRAGRLRPAAEQVQVEALVRDVIALLSPPEGFVIRVEGGALTLRTPRASLELVLRNLIGNAIKHHDRTAGEILIAATAQEDWVEFCVRDDGPGIDPRYHAKIFEMFQTLQPRDQMEGSGMGLAIVKKLVESYGGEIYVASARGAGAMFRFTWPQRPLGRRRRPDF